VRVGEERQRKGRKWSGGRSREDWRRSGGVIAGLLGRVEAVLVGARSTVRGLQEK
jgi:hypothetical protein